MMVSVRSHLTAGLAAGLVAAAAGAAVVAPVEVPSPLASPAVELAVDLAALFSPLPELPEVIEFAGVAASPGEWVINAYNVIQPWVAYGVELFAWAVEWLPWPIGLLAPQATIVYSGWQPIVEAVVYSFAFLLDGQFDLIVPTLAAGIQTGVTDLIRNEIAWILSFFPPLPPIGDLAAFAAIRPAAARSASNADVVAPETDAADTAPGVTEAEAGAEVTAEVVAVPEVADAAPAPQTATRTSHRNAVRAQRQAPAPAAAAVAVPEAAETSGSTEISGVTGSPAPPSNARKGGRSGGVDGTSGRVARAERGAR